MLYAGEHLLSDMQFLYLASRSPRRRELLAQIGIPFQIVDIEIDESVKAGESAMAYVERVAREKAHAGHAALMATGALPAPVLAADTTVALGSDILGKPINAEDAIVLLTRLSGREHFVHTGIALVLGEHMLSKVVTTRVQFVDITQQQIEGYVALGEPMDKAGAYGIQGYGGVLVEWIAGSYSNVVGLPIQETAELAAHFGISCWQTDAGRQEAINIRP